jgi:Putative transmembrane protein (PGPGW)
MIKSLFDLAPVSSAISLLAGISLAMFLISLLLLPLVVAQLPRECFLKLQDPSTAKGRMSPGRITLLVLRNVLGMLLLLAGIIMLFLPGQGLLTMLLGILLLSIPGKARLVLRLTASPAIRKGLDWLRQKSGKPPFLWPQTVPDDQGNGVNGR